MIWPWLLGGTVVAIAAYVAGKRHGRFEANKQAIGPGTWVEARRNIHYPHGNSGGEIEPGTQALVTGTDRWERLSLWIASPWAENTWEGHPKVYGIEDYADFRIVPPWRVRPENRRDTLQALAHWEKLSAEINDSIFPPGWLELQRKLTHL